MEYKKRSRIARLRFTLKFVYGIPDDVLDKIDIEAYADPELTFKENLEKLIEAYPVISSYIRKRYKRIEEAERKAEKEWEEFLDTLKWIYEGVLEGIDECVERMRELGFEDVKEFEEYLRGLGIDVGKLKGEIEEYSEAEAELPEIPDEVFGYLDALGLEPYADIRIVIEGPPYYYREQKVCIIPVYDVYNDAVIRIVYPLPRKYNHKYTLLHILNKQGKPVSVVTFAEDAEKVEPWKPKIAEQVVKVVMKKMEEKPIKKTEIPEEIDWRKSEGLHKMLLHDVKAAENAYKTRSILAIWSTFRAIRDTLDDFKRILRPKLPPEMGIEKIVRITPEVEEYWEYFKKLCKNYGIDPDRYRMRFMEYIDPKGAREYNMRAVEDLIEEIVDEEEYRKRLMMPVVEIKEKVEEDIKRGKPKLKYVDWAIGAMKVKLFYLDMAISERDMVRAYMIVDELNELVDRIIDMLKLFPEIQRLLGGI